MNTINFIFANVIALVFGLFVVGIFIQSSKELWEEVGKDSWEDLKSTVISWFKQTKVGMWVNNKRNKVEILSEKEYQKTLKSTDVKVIYVELNK